MENRQYIWLNGEFFRDTDRIFNISNRAFAYGDGFFETMHAYGTEAKHVDLHFSRIVESIDLLGMEAPSFLNTEFLLRETTRLLNKNRIFGSARVRITFYRQPGGFYTPTQNGVDIAMQAQPLPTNFYPLNSKGLVVDVYTDIRKPINMLSPLKSCNSLLYVMAGKFKLEQKLDDCLIINDQNRLCEAISSNIFIVSGKKIITPSIEEGCVAGVMRQVVIDLATRLGYEVSSKGLIDEAMLVNADELFLTNAVSGIKWVVGIKQKRCFGVVSKKLSKALNEETFGAS